MHYTTSVPYYTNLLSLEMVLSTPHVLLDFNKARRKFRAMMPWERVRGLSFPSIQITLQISVCLLVFCLFVFCLFVTCVCVCVCVCVCL